MSRNPLRDAIDGGSDSSDADVSKSDESESRGERQNDATTVSTASRTEPTNSNQGVSAGREFVDTRVASGGRPTSVFKQEVDRRSTLAPNLRRKIEQKGGLPKPYDPALLRDVASHAVVQAYIDTLSQDLASATWMLEPRDADTNVDEQAKREAERAIEQLHPEKSFRDILEQTTRNLLELGDAVWVKHYYESGELAEAVPVDSARFYKDVDDHGITNAYLEASFQSANVSSRFDKDEVVWFEWASRTDHKYGMGPTEKGLDVIMLLEELSEKEKKDLMEGMPAGVLSAKEDADNPLPVDEYENVKEDFEQEEGERHRVVVSRGEWDFTNFSGSYQDLEILGRNKYWVSVLGAVYKVNPSYAGFDFENVNRATDETQQEAYAQRGFRQTLRQVEEAINKQLVWADISEDLQFTFEREQTVEEREQRVNFLDNSAQAAENWASLGRQVEVDSDGTISVEPGEVTEDDISTSDDGGGGGFGDMFASEDANSHEQRANDDADTDEGVGDDESMAKAIKNDEVLLGAHRQQIQPKSVESIEKRAWGGDWDVPEYVIENVKEAMDVGAVFDNIDTVPSGVEQTLENVLEDHLTRSEGWSLRDIIDELDFRFPGVSEDALSVVARTETASVLNTARELGYREREDAGELKFYWQGPDDSRTTDACEELKDDTNPQFGGTPVTLADLLRKEREMHEKHFPQLSRFRDHTIHPNERHTFVRAVETPDDITAPGVTEPPRSDVPPETTSVAELSADGATSHEDRAKSDDCDSCSHETGANSGETAKQDFGDDPCWDGYEMVGTKIDENGNEVPRCVPEDEVEQAREAKDDIVPDVLRPTVEKDEDDPCWDGYVMVGFKIDENGNEVPNCVPKDDADEAIAQYVQELAADVLAKQPDSIEDLDFSDYPEAASENAQMALDAREETGNPNDCGTDVGWARANQLADGENLSPDTVGRMAAFDRHRENSEMDDDEGRADCGWMMWKAWGGDEGVDWAMRMVERMEEIRDS